MCISSIQRTYGSLLTAFSGVGQLRFEDSHKSVHTSYTSPDAASSGTANLLAVCRQYPMLRVVSQASLACETRAPLLVSCLASSPARAKNGEAHGTHCLRMRLISPRCGDSGLLSDSSVLCDVRVRTRYSILVRIL